MPGTGDRHGPESVIDMVRSTHQPHLARAHAIDGYPQSFAKPALGVPCLEVLRELRSTKSERSHQKLRVAGSIPAASKQNTPPH